MVTLVITLTAIIALLFALVGWSIVKCGNLTNDYYWVNEITANEDLQTTYSNQQQQGNMKRKISADEVRQFFQTSNKQFEEAGFYLNAIRFKRNENGALEDINLNYTEVNKEFDDTIQHPTNNPTDSPK